MPYNGSNPHSIVVIDDAFIHYGDGIYDLICDAGALLMYLPSYSPKYNPIEEFFSKSKAVVKMYQAREIWTLKVSSMLLWLILPQMIARAGFQTVNIYSS